MAFHRFGVAALCLFGAGATLSGQSLVAGSGTARPDKPATIQVTYRAGGAQLTGLQFDVEFDAAAIEIGAELGSAGKAARKSLAFNRGGNRIVVAGLNQQPLADGVVVVLRVAGKGKPTGRFPIRLTAAVGSDAQGNPVPALTSDGSVTLEGGEN